MSGRCVDCASATFGGSGLTVECGKGHGYNIDAQWGCSDWSTKGEVAVTIHEQIAEQWRRVDEEQAKLHDLQAQRDAAEGDVLGAEWHRLQAVSLREQTPESAARAHRAWLVMMATSHLRRGSAPDEGAHEAEAIEHVMDELRADDLGDLLADRPSHSTETP